MEGNKSSEDTDATLDAFNPGTSFDEWNSRVSRMSKGFGKRITDLEKYLEEHRARLSGEGIYLIERYIRKLKRGEA